MSDAVKRSGALEGEVLPPEESSLSGWGATRVERGVLLEGRVRQLQTAVRAQLTVHMVQTAATVHEGCREILHTVLKKDLADQKTMTDPRVKGFMEQYDDDAINQLRDGSLGTQRDAIYAAESLIRRPFDVDAPEPPLTFWEVLLGRASLGDR